jgi:glycosyltransferase involved in cell wall biosynthesis
MRILVFSQHFWPESFRINEVAHALRAAGHEVLVLTGQPNYPGGQVLPGYSAASTGVEDYGGIAVHRVPLWPRGRGGAWRLAGNYLSFIASAVLFGAWRLRRQRVDVVLVYATSPLLQAIAAVTLARLKRAALVTWVQDLWPQSLRATGYVTHPRLLAAVALVVRWIYARQDLLLVQSEGFVDAVRALAPARVEVRVHPNPAEAQVANPPPAPLTLPPGFNVVFAGNLGTTQALDALLDAAERLRDLPALRLVFVGSGQRSAWLAGEVARRGLPNVLLAGRHAPEHMPSILGQAQALLVSLADDPALQLTVPSKLQSYLAAGRPIVAALRGEGARLLEAAGAGLSCPPGDGAALEATLRRLLALDEGTRAAMGEAGRAFHARHFSPAQLTPRLEAHLSDAIRVAQTARRLGRRQ